MKKIYEKPVCEILEISKTDIITTSPDMPFIGGDDLFEDGL